MIDEVARLGLAEIKHREFESSQLKMMGAFRTDLLLLMLASGEVEFAPDLFVLCLVNGAFIIWTKGGSTHALAAAT